MTDKNNKKTGFFASFTNMFKRILLPNGQKTGLTALEEEAIQTPTKVILRNFFSNKMAIIGLVGFVFIFSFSFIGSMLNPVNFVYNEPVLKNIQPGKGYLSFPKSLNNKEIVKIQSGVSFSMALDTDGKLTAWGVDQNKVLSIPADVKNAKIKDFAVGDRHVVALAENGKVYGWGYNNFLQAEVPVEIAGALMLSNVEKVYAGESYTALLTDDKELWVWGAVESSGLDIIPSAVQGRIVDADTSSYNMVLLLDDGTVGVVGVKGSDVNNIPTELTDGSVKVVDVAMSFRTGLALDDQGKIHVWGSSDNKLLQAPEINEKIVSIDGGKNSLVAVGESGTIYNWGANNLGETSVPKKINGKVTAVYTDYFQNYAITDTNKITAWGNNGYYLGTDELGRDMFTRLMHGGKITLVVGVIAVVISTLIGLIVGMVAGFVGGWVDNLLMRIAEIITSVPFMP
ncbi:MAG: ABC transporter permease subunit, partial [Erysipelotrichaceae bacterium]